MRRKIRKRYVFLNVFLLCCVIAAGVIILSMAREYTCEIPASDDPPSYRPIGVSYESDSEHVQITDIHLTDTSVVFTAKPVSPGRCMIKFQIDIEDQPEPGFDYREFVAGPFGTVFSLWPQDFNGSIWIIMMIMLALAVVMTVTLFSFIDYLRKKDFGYPMVACGGIALFSLFCLVYNVSIMTDYGTSGFFLTEYFRRITFGTYLSVFSWMGAGFTFFTAPFMMIFSMSLAVSNLYLIRREGFRFVNLLGILFAVLWFSGFILYITIDENSSGSYEHFLTFSSFSSAISTIITYLECMLFSTVLCAYLASRHKPSFDRDYIVILGCAIRKDGTLTPLLKGRVDAALHFSKEQMEKTGKPLKFVPSGGQGADEILSEGEAMKRYLLEQGVEEAQILPETQSTDTFENVRFSKDIIENDTKEEYNAAFATTNYHIFRGYILSKKNNLKNAQGISAKTKWYFFPNAFLRELVGLIVDEKKVHIVAITLLVIFFVLINFFVSI